MLILKPDAFELGLVGSILEQLYDKPGVTNWLQIRCLQLMEPEASQLYWEHRGKGFYPTLVDFMITGPSCLIRGVPWDLGMDFRQHVRETMIPKGSPSYANLIHASDSLISWNREEEWAQKLQD